MLQIQYIQFMISGIHILNIMDIIFCSLMRHKPLKLKSSLSVWLDVLNLRLNLYIEIYTIRQIVS